MFYAIWNGPNNLKALIDELPLFFLSQNETKKEHEDLRRNILERGARKASGESASYGLKYEWTRPGCVFFLSFIKAKPKYKGKKYQNTIHLDAFIT